MNDDYERLQLQTKKKYVLDTFRNGLRCIQDDSKVAQKFVFLCLALAVVALFFASGSSGNDVLSVVFRPIIYAVYRRHYRCKKFCSPQVQTAKGLPR